MACLPVSLSYSFGPKYQFTIKYRLGIPLVQHCLCNPLSYRVIVQNDNFGSKRVRVMACCLVAPGSHLNNVDLSSMRPVDIELRVISQKLF